MAHRLLPEMSETLVAPLAAILASAPEDILNVLQLLHFQEDTVRADDRKRGVPGEPLLRCLAVVSDGGVWCCSVDIWCMCGAGVVSEHNKSCVNRRRST